MIENCKEDQEAAQKEEASFQACAAQEAIDRVPRRIEISKKFFLEQNKEAESGTKSLVAEKEKVLGIMGEKSHRSSIREDDDSSPS